MKNCMFDGLNGMNCDDEDVRLFAFYRTMLSNDIDYSKIFTLQDCTHEH